MLPTAAVRPWICAGCLRRQITRRRQFHSPAAVRSIAASITTHRPPGASQDDTNLRRVFDSPSFWADFSRSARSNGTRSSSGLFRNRYLQSPAGWDTFTEVTLAKAQAVVQRILKAESVQDYKCLVRDLDRLSDLLCRVLDLAEFVRSTHPDPTMQTAATRAFARMYEYMNILNTTTELHAQLKRAYTIDEVTRAWSEEESKVMDMLRRDFEKSAINMPAAARRQFVQLSQEINEVGTNFVDTMTSEQDSIRVASDRLKGMDPVQVAMMTRRGTTTIPLHGGQTAAALETVDDEATRRSIFIANKTASSATLYKLDTLLRKRGELARLARYPDYGHMALGDKMANSPESVEKFLKALASANASGVERDLQKLQSAKDSHLANMSGRQADPELHAWDRSYYQQRLLAHTSKIRQPDFIPAYFSLGTVMQGLSRLFTRLYGIRLVPREAAPGEAWNPDIRRIDVLSEDAGHVAVLYCDLFARPGKAANPCHFTLRCSREITKEELAEAKALHQDLFSTSAEAANDGMATSERTASGSVYQLPTIALICDFAKQDHRPALLSLGEYQTLFHEMGHAIHSILGRTSLQNVAGTRCPTDFAELPSILMEHFATDSSVLQLFARHYETDEPLPHDLIASHLARDKQFEAMDVEHHILLALLDQAYHSTLPMSPWFSSTATYHHIWRQYGHAPYPPEGTSYQGFFGHLFGYGASYYSYLFDRVLARRVWKRVFADGANGMAIDRRRGDRFAREVLGWGGSRDPWLCLANVLGEADGADVHRGDQVAMEHVGRWGWAREEL